MAKGLWSVHEIFNKDNFQEFMIHDANLTFRMKHYLSSRPNMKWIYAHKILTAYQKHTNNLDRIPSSLRQNQLHMLCFIGVAK